MDQSQDAHRAACEARWLMRLPPHEQVEFCKLVEKHRGREAAVSLYKAAQAARTAQCT